MGSTITILHVFVFYQPYDDNFVVETLIEKSHGQEHAYFSVLVWLLPCNFQNKPTFVPFLKYIPLASKPKMGLTNSSGNIILILKIRLLLNTAP